MTLKVTPRGTGSPMPSPDRAGPATLISAGEGAEGEHYLVDASRRLRFDFRSDQGVAAVVAVGDTVPGAGLDALYEGADALVHTVIRKDIIANFPMQRMQDTLDDHSSPGESAQTAAKAGIDTLMYTHYVPPMPLSGSEDDRRALGAAHFDGAIELGDDLHTVTVNPTTT